jgi:hypothetical protein
MYLKIKFTLQTKKNLKFEVGRFHRFDWQDLYHVLQVLNDIVLGKESRFLLGIMLSSTKETVHEYLWELLDLLNFEHGTTGTGRVQVCMWVISCYGYIHGLKSSEGKAWPHPSPLQRTKYANVPDWRTELKCPLCHRKYKIPRRLKRKNTVLKHFGVWMHKHFCSEKH